MSYTTKLINQAEGRLRHGVPLPLDLSARLMEVGVDPSAIEERIQNEQE